MYLSGADAGVFNGFLNFQNQSVFYIYILYLSMFSEATPCIKIYTQFVG